MQGEGVKVGEEGEPGQLRQPGDPVTVQVNQLQVGEPANIL